VCCDRGAHISVIVGVHTVCGVALALWCVAAQVAGNFHVAMGQTHTRDSRHIHQFNPSLIAQYNVSHTIHR
jgi:hypothetical protein